MAISVIIITRNEESNLAECLQCLGFADEVVVLDHASTDHTVEIAKSWGAQVHSTPDWPGFGPQKNRALALARGPWVLSLDADERVTPALQEEILKVVSLDTDTCFAIPRTSWFCGRFMLYSGWQPDYVDRLFKMGTARFSDDLVHEKLLHDGCARQLKSPMQHFSHRNFADVLTKIDRYSSASAAQASARGCQSSVWGAVGHGLWAFVRTYILKAGFMDGAHGLALAIATAEGSYYRHVKLWQIRQTNRN